MGVVVFLNLQNAFHNTQAYFTSMTREWAGYIVMKIQSGLPYLKDPRIASGAIFIANFGILELAARTSQVMCLSLPRQTASQKSIKSAIEITLTGSMALVGNIAFVKATGILLSPLIIGAVAVATFITKYNLQSYLENR